MNEILDFKLRCKFRSIWTCFGNIITKTENKFFSPVFLIKFMCISNIFFHHQNVSPKNHEISVTWYLLKSVMQQRCEHRDARISENKWKPCYWHINHQSRVIQERRWKFSALKTFDFTEIVNEWKWKRGTVCHIVRFISQLS